MKNILLSTVAVLFIIGGSAFAQGAPNDYYPKIVPYSECQLKFTTSGELFGSQLIGKYYGPWKDAQVVLQETPATKEHTEGLYEAGAKILCDMKKNRECY